MVEQGSAVKLKVTRRLQLSGAAIATVATLGGLAAPQASAAQPRVRVGSAAALPTGTHVVGAASRTARLHLDVALSPRDPLALKRYATAVATPGSSVYRGYLSVAGFAHRFGATPAHTAAVRAALRSDGLEVSKVSANGLTLHVSGRTAAVERAFAVSLKQVRTAGGRVTDANVSAPTLPAGVAPWVQGVIGLDGTQTLSPTGVERPNIKSLTHAPAARTPQVSTNGGPQPCADATDVQTDQTNLGYDPYAQTADEIATAYGFPSFYGQGIFGQNQHVALIELGQAYNPTDISTFQSCYATATVVNPINIDGGPAAGSGTDESELDIEILLSMAPQSTIDVYQAPSGSGQSEIDALTQAVTANVDKVISLSYGGCEEAGDPTTASEATLLQEAAVQGQSFFASSGDQGSVCDNSTTTPSVNDPASDPYATAVGGTALYGGGTAAAGNLAAYAPGGSLVQSVWNDGVVPQTDEPAGGGGGISSLFAMPGYQATAAAGLGVTANGSAVPCATQPLCRELPDVSADADPNTGYITYINDPTSGAGGWAPIGGTSAAAPLWAAYTALSDDLPSCAGKTLGFLNPSLYEVAGASYATNFQDVATASPFAGVTDPGTNDALGNNSGVFPVTANYDMATGLGTMTASLGASLCAVHPVVAITTPATVPAVVGTPLAFNVTATDSQNEQLTYAAAGLPAGLAINPATGAIAGTPTAAGTATVTVTATDVTGVSAATAPFAVTITTPPPPVKKKKKQQATNRPSKVTLTGLTKRKPKLSFDWDVAKGSKALTGVEIKLPKGLSFGKAKALRKGVVIRSGKKGIAARAHVSKRVLTLKFRKKTTALSLVIRKPALKITRAEARKIKKGKVKKLKIKVIGISRKKHIARTVTIKKLR